VLGVKGKGDVISYAAGYFAGGGACKLLLQVLKCVLLAGRIDYKMFRVSLILFLDVLVLGVF
jgi:hypothetical protein